MKQSGATAIVTGGLSGLGLATVNMLAKSGAYVGIIDLPVNNKKEKNIPDNTILVAADVCNQDEVQEAIYTVEQKFGKISICVNCAGIASAATVLGKDGPHDLDAFNRTIQINLTGTFNVLRLAAESMKNNLANEHGECGVIINTSSIAGTDGQRGQSAYAASKAGVSGMTLPIARDLGRFGIRVNTIAPGIFNTPMVQGLNPNVRESLADYAIFPKRLGHPDEFAALVKFLIECSYMNGAEIRIDGGARLP